MPGSIFFLAAAAALQAAPPDPYVLDVPADGLFDGSISGGPDLPAIPARTYVSPHMPYRPFLTARLAEAARLVPVPVPHSLRVGSVRIDGTPSSAIIALAGQDFARGVTWFDGPMVEGADLFIGPQGLPWEQVRFHLRPAQPGERRLSFQIVRETLISTVVRFRIGRQEVRLGFAPERPVSIATAAAGALLARTNGGQLGDAAQRQPIRLATGVMRPARTMQLARPLAISGLSLSSLLVRTRDFGGDTRLPGLDEGDGETAPDEVIVTAHAESSPAVYYIMLGADALAPCSTITFDNRRNRVELSCLVAEARD